MVAFTGRLFSMSRAQAAEAVARSGGTTDSAPGSHTTIIVVGADAAPADPEREPEAGRRARRGPAPMPGASDRGRVMSEDEFCRLVGRVAPSDLRSQYYGWRTVQPRYPSVRDDHVRYLEKWGLLGSVVRTPGDLFLGFADLSVQKQANAELEAGTPFRAVVRALELRNAVQRLPLELESLDRRRHAATVTVSIGVARYPEDGESVQDLWRAANQALLEAKRKGKNRVVSYGGPEA